MHNEKILSKQEAINMIDADQITSVLHPQFVDSTSKKLFEKGLNASPGAAVGEIVFDPEKAEIEAARGKKVILVRDETSPEDISGMFASVGILTTKGGMTSHAAVVARGMGKPCIVGAENLKIDKDKRKISNGQITIEEGDLISLDGSTGEIFLGEVELESPKLTDEFNILMAWCDDFKKLSIRANAETVNDTTKSLEFGADGIGLCRTEHMFFEGERILPMREMIMANNKQGRKRALNKIIDFQINDFVEIFKSSKRIFILTITAFLITGNWAGFIYSVGQERVQDASMGYFITPMISIVLGYFFLNEKITMPKFASVCLMFSGILFLFINLNQFPFLIIWIGTSWAIYGLLRKQVNVNPSIGLLYETFIISLISIPYLVYLFWQNENSIFSIDFKTSLFLILTGAVTIFPLFFFNMGLKFIQLGLAGVLFYLAPTFHFITSVFILNEEILQIKLVSFIIIWIGIIIYIYDSYKKEIILNNTQ